MNAELNSHFPSEVFERRAEEQRERIAESVTDLKESLRESVREHLDMNTFARHHLWKMAGIASLLAMATGYAVAGMFTRH
ncbi:MAG TPA: hypothetical protein VGG15_10475 [Terriglobales bacterium]|jgi:hypothetical protein